MESTEIKLWQLIGLCIICAIALIMFSKGFAKESAVPDKTYYTKGYILSTTVNYGGN